MSGRITSAPSHQWNGSCFGIPEFAFFVPPVSNTGQANSPVSLLVPILMKPGYRGIIESMRNDGPFARTENHGHMSVFPVEYIDVHHDTNSQ